MTPVMLLIVGVVGFVIWYVLFETEGVYLGRRVVIWMYDLYAARYNNIKQNDDVREHTEIARPVMNALHPITSPLILDVATGTGRIPLALCQHARFEGHIMALDLSRGMLRQAAAKIQQEHFDDYVTWLWATGETLPFEDASFEMVTCMEALEFMPDPRRALRECCRVLRDGGWLLTTNRQGVVMPGRVWSDDEMRQHLTQNNMIEVHILRWQVDYKLVWARKAGDTAPVLADARHSVLRCPQHQQPLKFVSNANYRCAAGHEIHTDEDGILPLFPLQ